MPTDEKPKGPASYFPSIEKTYGQPIAHWLELTRSRQEMKHMELVSWLKTEPGLGHGHANAIVACVRAEGEVASGTSTPARATSPLQPGAGVCTRPTATRPNEALQLNSSSASPRSEGCSAR